MNDNDNLDRTANEYEAQKITLASGMSTAATMTESEAASVTKDRFAHEKSRETIQASFFRRARTKTWPRALAFLIDVPFICIIGAALAGTTNLLSTDILFGPSIVAAMASMIYHVCLESSPWQATVGKRVLGMRTIAVNGEPIGFGRSMLRSFARISNWITLGVADTLCMLFGQRAVYHDMVSRTRSYDLKEELPGDIEKLKLGNDMNWGIGKMVMAGAALTFNALVIVYFGVLVYASAQVRNNMTKAYESVIPALEAVKAQYDKGGAFPANLTVIQRDQIVKSEGLKSVEYVGEQGIFLLTMEKATGFDGVMYVAPVVNVPGMKGKVTWVCGSFKPILQNQLPNVCPSRERLALRILIDREKFKGKP